LADTDRALPTWSISLIVLISGICWEHDFVVDK